MNSFNPECHHGYYNNDLIMRIDAYAKAMHYRVPTVMRIIDAYHKRHRKHRISTPHPDFIKVDVMWTAVSLYETSIKKIETKATYHDAIKSLVMSSHFIHACVRSNILTEDTI